MGSNRFTEILEKIPFMLFFVLFLAYVGYQFYSFTSLPDSLLFQKRALLESKLEEKKQTENKIKVAKEFYRTFEQKRVGLRDLTLQLESLKTSLSDHVDVPLFIKTVVQEAEKVGLTVVAIKPSGQEKRDFYMEQSFDLSFSGVYVQLLVFLDHISTLDRIMRVENLDLHRKGLATAPYVEITGKVQVKTYSYLGSKADDVAKELNKNGSPNPSTIPAPGVGGPKPVPLPQGST